VRTSHPSQFKLKKLSSKKKVAVEVETAEPTRLANPILSVGQLRSHWRTSLGLLTIFLFCAGLTFFLLRGNFLTPVAGTQPIESSAPTPESTPEPPKELIVLLLGYGGGTHDGGLLTDTMMVARVDPVNKYIALISIPRDLWVPLPLQANAQPVWGKINSAYAIGNDTRGFQVRDDQFKGDHGGGTLAKTVVATVTGLQPSYYAGVNFDAFTQAIDTIGPLTVTVPYTFDDPLYPIRGEEKNLCQFTEADLATLSATFKNAELEKQFACRYELLHFDKGKQIMDGETALKFVRSRHGTVGGSDFGRAQRQQALVDAVKQKVFSLSFIPRILPLAQQMLNNIQTDVKIADLPTLLGKFSDITSYTLYSITLTDENVLKNGVSSDRQFVLIPKAGQGNWSEIQYYIGQELKKATASAALVASASAVPATTN
jgi:anionic cell wall polymer biosynthesis LytR-Cps2A-Psr (LCP) family protein